MSKRPEPIWARSEPGSRRPRYSREQIAATALAIADAEGIAAVSMRRVAAELGAGTMTLYHYVRTKADLVDLMDDAIMGEVLVPEGELPPDWREALRMIALRSRAVFARHPWAFEGLQGARGGPNGMRHFEQSLLAVAALELEIADKIELVATVDDYVFGFVLRNSVVEGEGLEQFRDTVLPYFTTLLDSGEYPEIERQFGRDAAAGFDLVFAAFRSEDRFERGLDRLLAGIGASLAAQ